MYSCHIIKKWKGLGVHGGKMNICLQYIYSLIYTSSSFLPAILSCLICNQSVAFCDFFLTNNASSSNYLFIMTELGGR